MVADVTIIQEYDPNSYNSVPHFFDVAANEDAAKRRIEEYTNDESTGYVQGKTADWWITHHYFILRNVKVYE